MWAWSLGTRLHLGGLVQHTLFLTCPTHNTMTLTLNLTNPRCSPTSGVETKTSFDTSAMYMASGHLLSPNGNNVYLYASGNPSPKLNSNPNPKQCKSNPKPNPNANSLLSLTCPNRGDHGDHGEGRPWLRSLPLCVVVEVVVWCSSLTSQGGFGDVSYTLASPEPIPGSFTLQNSLLTVTVTLTGTLTLPPTQASSSHHQ